MSGQASSKAHQLPDVGTCFNDKKQMNVEGELLSFATMTHEPEEIGTPLLSTPTF